MFLFYPKGTGSKLTGVEAAVLSRNHAASAREDTRRYTEGGKLLTTFLIHLLAMLLGVL
jgi:hypothetical protein